MTTYIELGTTIKGGVRAITLTVWAPNLTVHYGKQLANNDPLVSAAAFRVREIYHALKALGCICQALPNKVQMIPIQPNAEIVEVRS